MKFYHLFSATMVCFISATSSPADGPSLDREEGWELVSISVEGEVFPARVPDPGKTGTSLRIVDGLIRGSFGTNSFHGMATIDPKGGFRANHTMVTLIKPFYAGEAEEQERFLTVLREVEIHEIQDGKLTLSDREEVNQLRFCAKGMLPKSPLRGTRWVFRGVEKHSEETTSFVPVAREGSIDLKFGDDGGVSGNGGVNRYFGACQLDLEAGTVAIESLGATRKAGSPEEMRQEQRFLNLLEEVSGLAIQADRLRLRADAVSLLFRAEAASD